MLKTNFFRQLRWSESLPDDWAELWNLLEALLFLPVCWHISISSRWLSMSKPVLGIKAFLRFLFAVWVNTYLGRRYLVTLWSFWEVQCLSLRSIPAGSNILSCFCTYCPLTSSTPKGLFYFGEIATHASFQILQNISRANMVAHVLILKLGNQRQDW